MSTLLLGVPDVEVEPNIQTTWEVNKIGGKPDELIRLPTTTCVKCETLMTHVVQIYCPLELSPFHRVLHLFGCTSKACWNSQHGWKVFRSQLRDSCHGNNVSPLEKKEKFTMETSDWCEDADDWGCEDNTSDLVAMVNDNKQDKLNEELRTTSDKDLERSESSDTVSVDTKNSEEKLVSEFEELDVDANTSEVMEEDNFICPNKETVSNVLSYLATSSQSDETTQEDTEIVLPGEQKYFKAFYLNVFDEPVDDPSDARHVKTLLKEYERRERVDVNSLADNCDLSPGKSGHEKYEKTEIKHGDKYFHKFMKRLKICPEQVIRYQLGGHPLPISPPKGDLTPAACPHCRAPRVFEMQLVPPLIPYLQYPHVTDPAVEFGTVMVYTCSESCWEEEMPQPREEFVIVQSDPDQHLFKV